MTLKRHRQSTHPGKLLLEHYMKPRGIDAAVMASLSGINEEVLEALINGTGQVDEDIAEQLACAFKTTREFWLNSQLAFDQQRSV